MDSAVVKDDFENTVVLSELEVVAIGPLSGQVVVYSVTIPLILVVTVDTATVSEDEITELGDAGYVSADAAANLHSEHVVITTVLPPVVIVTTDDETYPPVKEGVVEREELNVKLPCGLVEEPVLEAKV